MHVRIINPQEQVNFEQYCQMSEIIISCFCGNPLNEVESSKLDEWLNRNPQNRQWFEKLDSEDWLTNTIGAFRPMPANESFAKTMSLINYGYNE